MRVTDALAGAGKWMAANFRPQRRYEHSQLCFTASRACYGQVWLVSYCPSSGATPDAFDDDDAPEERRNHQAQSFITALAAPLGPASATRHHRQHGGSCPRSGSCSCRRTAG